MYINIYYFILKFNYEFNIVKKFVTDCIFSKHLNQIKFQ